MRLISEDGTHYYVDFEDGKKEGKEIGFYENGKTEYENYFKDGKQEGK